MKKIVRNWVICSSRLVGILILSIAFIFSPLLMFNIINFVIALVSIGITLVSLSIFLIFGKVFINKIMEEINKIYSIIRNISKDFINFESYSNFSSNNEIDNILDTMNEVIFKIKSIEHSKNDFISLMSHELRTPLTAIKGWAETMKNGDKIDYSTLRRGLEVIISETDRLTDIVEELIDFSSLESGRMKVNMVMIDILFEINEIVFIFKERANFEKKTIFFDVTDAIPNTLGDRNRLRQVFVNILDNSIKYTSPGGVIKISMRFDENKDISKNMIVVTVKDNGIGIHSESLPKVKQKFYKANYNYKGYGIGLSIADEIINLHGGKIEISSIENKGTKVCVHIPVKS